MVKMIVKIGDIDKPDKRSKITYWNLMAGFGTITDDEHLSGEYHNEIVRHVSGTRNDCCGGIHAEVMIFYCEEEYWAKWRDVIIGCCTEKYCKVYLTVNGQVTEIVR